MCFYEPVFYEAGEHEEKGLVLFFTEDKKASDDNDRGDQSCYLGMNLSHFHRRTALSQKLLSPADGEADASHHRKAEGCTEANHEHHDPKSGE